MEEVLIPRAVPAGLSASEADFGYDLLPHALKLMVGDSAISGVKTLTGINFALFAPAGQGKSAVAARLCGMLREACPWMTTLHSVWIQATWVANFCTPNAFSDYDQKPVHNVLSECRLLTIDGLGEETDRGRDRVVNVVKTRLDAGRPTILTSRLPLDGAASLAALYPHVRRVLDKRFLMGTPSR
jgi:DNA replication protein DnaC